MKNKLILVISITLFPACTTLQNHLGSGAAIGAVVGGSLAAVSQVPRKNPGKSAALGIFFGASLGTLLGYLTFKENQEKASRASLRLENQSDEPALSNPIVRKVLVPGRVEGNRYVGPHYIYVIDKDAKWHSPPETTATPE